MPIHSGQGCYSTFTRPDPATPGKLMMRLVALLFTLIASVSTAANAADGMIALKSKFSATQTMDRMEDAVKARGLRVFNRIDHAAGAASIGKSLRPTALLIFGNPQGGTPLMECGQTAGIDLPLKALVWEDATGQVWLGYDDPAYIAQRHALQDCPAVAGLQKALSGLAKAAIAP